jgi:ribosome-binding factor A
LFLVLDICGMAGTTRQQKFSRLIQKELSEIFQRDRRGILENAFVTIADVRVSPDLGVAKIYISMMLVKNKQELLTKITKRKNEIRKALGNKIAKQVRIVPELIFFIDEIEEEAIRMDKVLGGLVIPPAMAASAEEE